MDLLLLLAFTSLQSQSFIGFSIHQTHESASASGITPGGGITSFFSHSKIVPKALSSFFFHLHSLRQLSAQSWCLLPCLYRVGVFCLEIKLYAVCFWFFVLLCFHANHGIYHALSLFSLTFATMLLVPHAE